MSSKGSKFSVNAARRSDSHRSRELRKPGKEEGMSGIGRDGKRLGDLRTRQPGAWSGSNETGMQSGGREETTELGTAE
jgi:hypothetical protein